MASPQISASINKTQFVPGEQMVLTVQYSDADNTSTDRQTTVTGTDQDGNSTTVTIVTTTVQTDEVTLSVTDNTNRTWTKTSDDGSTAVFESVA